MNQNYSFMVSLEEAEEILHGVWRKEYNGGYYFLYGYADFEKQAFTCYRASGENLIVPFDIFETSGDGTIPDFEKTSIIDYGQTLKMGDYEACVRYIVERLT